MEDTRENAHVPYVVYRDVAAQDRWIIRRLIRALIVAVILMFLSNVAWLVVWFQYDYTTEETITTVDSEGDGIANYTGRNGGVIYGEGDSENPEN